MRNRRSEAKKGEYVRLGNCGVFSSMWDEMRDRTMKDQKLYLISTQEQRVGFHLLTAIELSERLDEFVSCMMKMRATLKTSLFLLLELKAYPVNCSTRILHVVVRFCKAKLSLDGARLRDINFMSTTEERSYWINFLWRDLDASTTLLQVGKDLGIESLIQVVHLVHQPSCTAFFGPQALDMSVEERRFLLSSSKLTSRASGHQIVRIGGEVVEDAVRSPFRNQSHCLPGFKLADIVSLLLGNLTSHNPADVSVLNWGLSEPVLPTLVAEERADQSSSCKSLEHVMSLSELMRLESVVQTVNDADDLKDVVSGLSSKFDACSVTREACSTAGSKQDQSTVRTHRLSKSWSYTAFSNHSPAKVASSRDKSAKKKKEVHFQISPKAVGAEDAELPLENSVPKLEHPDSVSSTGETKEAEETFTCTSDANSNDNDEVFRYVPLGIKRSTKQKLVSGLKAAARTLWIAEKGRTKGSSGASPQLSPIAPDHS